MPGGLERRSYGINAAFPNDLLLLMPASQPQPHIMSQRRVLVVDDNHDIADTMVAILRAEGHIASACYDGGEVLHSVRNSDPDVVILDIALPNKNGWQVAEEIRQRFAPGRPLIIGVSGEYTKEADRVLSKMRGFDYYLVKPADPDVVVSLVRQAAVR